MGRGRTQNEKWRELRVVLTPSLAKPLCALSVAVRMRLVSRNALQHYEARCLLSAFAKCFCVFDAQNQSADCEGRS